MKPSDFLADYFSASTGSIYLCSLHNERNGGRPAEICGRGNGARLDDLCNSWDKKDRGTFFCANTLKPRQAKRSKDTVFEIIAVHADIDFDKVEATPEQILAQLNGLECLPSKIVSSGHGYHVYWLLREVLPADTATVAQTESLLRAIANVVGGDPAVCEVARLMRLPGSYNTKNGGRIKVEVIVDRPVRYEFDELTEWAQSTRPLIQRRGSGRAADNAFLAANIPVDMGGASVDIEVRLAAMRYQGEGDSAVHLTQLATTAALLNRGTPVEETVGKVLAATRIAAGNAGERWDWGQEEKDIRGMCASWQRKKSNGQSSAQQRGATMEEVGMLEFKPVPFLVPNLIPAEGVCLVCSKPKVGKSFLLFDLCISVAMQREFLTGDTPPPGNTLYLALEDSMRRLRSRGEMLLAGHYGPWPRNMRVATEWARVDAGGLDHVREWAMDVRAAGGNPTCVCVDVLKMIRPAGQDKKAAYDRDYEALTGLRALAQELGIAVIVAHHTRKAQADDLLDMVSGTLGLSGAADTIIVIERQSTGGFVFDIRGRDVESAQLAAAFDGDTCRWRISGTAAEARMSDTTRAILAALADAPPEGMAVKDIANAANLSRNLTDLSLFRLCKAGAVSKTDRGRYVRTA